MTRDREEIFSTWAQPPAQTEEQRSENAIRSIRNAISYSSRLKERRLKVFTQGSYRNRVNVRKDSDVEVGVMLYEYFLWQVPEGKTPADFGINIVDYSFSQFKDDLEDALVAHFGRAAVKRGNKAFNIRENTYHVEADVVPLFEFRQYWEQGDYRAGVSLLTDKEGRKIENYPERLVDYWPQTPLHYENGNSKNTATTRRYRGLVRIPQEDSQRNGIRWLITSEGDTWLSTGMYDLERAECSFRRSYLGCTHSGCAAAPME